MDGEIILMEAPPHGFYLHIDDAGFVVTPERQAAYDKLLKDGNSDTIEENVQQFQQTDHGAAFDEFNLFENNPPKHIINVGVIGHVQLSDLNPVTKSVKQVLNDDATFAGYIEQLATTNTNQQGKLTMNYPHDIVITSENAEAQLKQTPAQVSGRGHTPGITHLDESPFVSEKEVEGDVTYSISVQTPVIIPDDATEAEEDAILGAVADSREGQEQIRVNIEDLGTEDTDKVSQKVGVIGVGSGALSFAQAVNARNRLPQEDVEVKLPTPKHESNSQRKKRLAEEHNAKINPNKYAIVKFRTFGLKVQLEVLELGARAVLNARDRGLFVIYTTKSANSSGMLCTLPTYQHHNKSTVNPVTLDWLLDQVGETNAFEIRTGRLRASTPLKYTIDKTEAEWVAKGFYIHEGEVQIDSMRVDPNLSKSISV